MVRAPQAAIRVDKGEPGVGPRPYLAGIGGCGMSALARLLQSRGCAVTGCSIVMDASPLGWSLNIWPRQSRLMQACRLAGIKSQ